MDGCQILESLDGMRVHLVGIKGTGMVGLADVLRQRAARVTGSDTDEVFYTDEILNRLGIVWRQPFSEANIADDTQLVIYSPAYSRETHPELVEAASRGIPLVSYPEALGVLSRQADSSGVAGTHGKSTTTALTGTILKELGVPATVLLGAAVSTFDGRSAMAAGEKYFVAEACEYRRHFLFFRPHRIVVTSVEEDHLDYFRGLEDVLDAFVEFADLLPDNGQFVYNADDPGVLRVVDRVRAKRSRIVFCPYGQNSGALHRILEISEQAGRTEFRLQGWSEPVRLTIPGLHSVWNAVAAIVLSSLIYESHTGESPDQAIVSRAVGSFAGCRRRSEVVGESRGVLFLDDYAHHPTAIAKTIDGIRRFYPGRRIVVDFMPHLYSRTRALLGAFGTSFASADEVILHRIYASAREDDPGDISGEDLYREVAKNHRRVFYFEDVEDAGPHLESTLADGDLLLTLGAGDNWRIGRLMLDALKKS